MILQNMYPCNKIDVQDSNKYLQMTFKPDGSNLLQENSAIFFYLITKNPTVSAFSLILGWEWSA